MNTIAIATNAFKGSLTAPQAAQAIADGLCASQLDVEISLLPLADGGDGTLDVFLEDNDSERIILHAEDPFGRTIETEYVLLHGTAIVEMARISGLALLGDELDAMHASSYGTGQLMADAIQRGAKRITLAVGGSATTDGGAGCLQALGVELLDKNEQPIGRGGQALSALQAVRIPDHLQDVTIEILCDVDNPPLGERGAAAVYAPQKGASAQQVDQLEANLSHYFAVLADQVQDVRDLAGGGAAGAIAGGLAAVLSAKLVKGAPTVIERLGYTDAIHNADVVITGEGWLDAQTNYGKAPAIVAQMANKKGIPVIALAGGVEADRDALQAMGITAAFSIVPRPASLEDAMQHGEDWLHGCAMNIGQLLYSLSN